MSSGTSGEQAGGANSDFQRFAPGDNADKVLSASYQNKLIAGIERMNRLTFGPGSDVIQFGPMTLKKRRKVSAAAASGDSNIISFSIIDADCIFGTATGSVTRIPCGSSSPAIGSTIDLVDDDGCYLIGDNELMVGRKGKAVKLTDGEYCEWCIISLCCGSISC